MHFFGCAANDVVVKRQAESEARIEQLIQSHKKTEQRINELAGQLQLQDERLQSDIAVINLLKGENHELRSSVEEIRASVTGIVRQSQTPKVEIVNQQSPPKVGRESGPPADYLKAFGLYSANNFPGAIEAFDSFLNNNPQSEYAANALYWIGECYYSLSDFPKAKEYFLKVAENYPKSSKAPDALLKFGYTLAAQKEKASDVFERIITLYPSSPAAVKARDRLNTH
jgi:tol-pal system protein YbgF